MAHSALYGGAAPLLYWSVSSAGWLSELLGGALGEMLSPSAPPNSRKLLSLLIRPSHSS
jgi:hypothetical protein